MIKVVSKSALGPSVILGISESNMRKLRKKRPVVATLDDKGLGIGAVVMVYGETDEEAVDAVGRAKDSLEGT